MIFLHYRNQNQGDGNMEIATRFIALAPVLNDQKKKWLYALNLTPVDRTRLSDLIMKTTDETSSPYPKSMLSDHPTSQKQVHTQFFYDMDSKDNARSRNQNSGPKKAKLEFDQSKCWFCLSSPVVSKHLVISVGTEIYLALAKGGLVEDHLLILPITHHQSLSILPKNVKEEMDLYKKAVTKYYESTDRVPVFFERNFKTSHCQLQAVPVHKNQAPALKEMFEVFFFFFHYIKKYLTHFLSWQMRIFVLRNWPSVTISKYQSCHRTQICSKSLNPASYIFM